MQIQDRKFSPSKALALMSQGLSPLLARLFASRGIKGVHELSVGVDELIPYENLKDCCEMAVVLADAVVSNKRLLILADYDADGATACSVAIRVLRAFGANVEYLIPNRIEHGYGLSKDIAVIAVNQVPKPDFIITVDNGIASHEGIDFCNSMGVPVLVTDHPLPTEVSPNAKLIVNPSQHGCSFESKALAGCGVIFYVMWAMYDELNRHGYEPFDEAFSIFDVLPIVALGTVADIVPLDENNRILVREGLKRVHEGCHIPGIVALTRVGQRNAEALTTGDIAFCLGPRINAAGRLEAMDTGVECLTTDDPVLANELAQALNSTNTQRKEIEAGIVDEAVAQLLAEVVDDRYTAVLHDKGWHTGVIGIVAGRVKEKVWRPTFVLAAGKDGEFKGSGRSIPGFHLRDALDLIDKRYPGILIKFGGHAMAAGVTIEAGQVNAFSEAFESIARELLTPAILNRVMETDGSLSIEEMRIETVSELKKHVWGQLFPEPTFVDVFRVVNFRTMGDEKQHMRMTVEKNGQLFNAVKFRHGSPVVPERVRMVYKLDSNTCNFNTTLQLLVEYIEAV